MFHSAFFRLLFRSIWSSYGRADSESEQPACRVQVWFQNRRARAKLKDGVHKRADLEGARRSNHLWRQPLARSLTNTSASC